VPRTPPWILAAATLAGACATPPAERPEAPAEVTAVTRPDRPGLVEGPVVLVHAGQGSPAAWSDGAVRGAEAGFDALGGGASALAAAQAAVRVLEDDPRFNAGRGANLRLDGRVIECDAAVMDDAGRFGAVAGVDGVRHPVELAARILGTPHLLVAGAGANALAVRLGLERARLATDRARRKLVRAYRALFEGLPPGDPWAGFDWRAHWNFDTPPPATFEQARAQIDAAAAAAVAPAARDTVGAVVRTADGRFAAALSTGGTTLALRGRVGDVPQRGAGLFAGPFGAVAATGRGEAIVRERVAAAVYDNLAAGMPARVAIRRAIDGIRPVEGVGVIAVSRYDHGAVATSQMAWAARGEFGTVRADEYVERW